MTKEDHEGIDVEAPRWNGRGNAQADPSKGWPDSLGDASLIGLAGEFVRLVEPHSEADPAALLIQFLAGFGNMVGRGRWFPVEATRHHPNLFVVLVGESAVARKGTSWSQTRHQLGAVDAAWSDRVATGLSSGEGLIFHVRDASEKKGEKKGDKDEGDPGVDDKRLLIVEPEFASTLKVMTRDGNTLSPVVRRAWDGDVLSTLTRKDSLRATGAHVSIIAHITRHELERTLRDVELANGFANRWLWICCRRSKVLPDGAAVQESAFTDFRRRLRAALNEVHSEPGEMLREDGDARTLWHAAYRGLTEPPPGLLGSVLSRGAAQVMRLALIYALLDRKVWIGKAHLEAALAVWRYAEESAAYIFGSLTGDPVADRILRLLGERRELPRTAIRDALSRHVTSEQLDEVRDHLVALALIHIRLEGTNGRPREVWVQGPKPPADHSEGASYGAH